MNLTAAQKRIVLRVVNVFETGTPDGKYDMLVIFKDGPHKIRQITFGRSQTTEYGNLDDLIRKYAGMGGTFSDAFKPFVDKIGHVPLTDDATFKSLLKKAAQQDPKMRTAQDEFFDEAYYNPALKWANDNGFKSALSLLVIYDSYIHSGGILKMIRNTFPESPPVNGGEEKAWIKAYVKARHHWLANHSNAILHATVYRMECFEHEIGRGNWDLSKLPIVANGTNVS